MDGESVGRKRSQVNGQGFSKIWSELSPHRQISSSLLPLMSFAPKLAVTWLADVNSTPVASPKAMSSNVSMPCWPVKKKPAQSLNRGIFSKKAKSKEYPNNSGIV